jgi:hypothetical protein
MKSKLTICAFAILTFFALVPSVRAIAERIGAYKDETVVFLNATTTSATSSPRIVSGARSVTFFFDRLGPNGAGVGTSTFSVQVSPDASSYVTYNKLISNVTNTNVQDLTRVGTVELTGTTTALYTMDLSGEAFYTARCIAVSAATGTATCSAIIQR